MSLKNIQLSRGYTNYEKDSIANALLYPALKQAKIYRQSVGLLSFETLKMLIDGISSVAQNDGRIFLIASPRLKEDDVRTISAEYVDRKTEIEKIFTEEFFDVLGFLEDEQLKLLLELVSKGYMDIKIAVTESNGIYGDKLGIITDTERNSIAFYGSLIANCNAHCEDYEKVRVVRSWIEGELESVLEEENEFSTIWNNANPFIDVFEFTECAQKNLFKCVTQRESKPDLIKLRDYQEEAIQAWKNNNYHGFYVMATGTGKTWTAIYSAKELLDKQDAITVICAPYKHLIKQWTEDVEKVFPVANIIMVSSENPDWENQLTKAIIKKKYDKDTQIIVISTISSFSLNRFITTLMKSEDQKLLIVDEAHRFTKRPEELHQIFHYMLGLSATPFSGKSLEKGKALMDFFGGQVFNMPIEKALEEGFLVPYYYHPIYVHSTEDEENRFRSYSQKIASCYRNNKLINPDLLVKSLRGRLRVISMADEKQTSLEQIIVPFKDKDHFVVYCGDGRMFDGDTGKEVRHIQSVKKTLSDAGFRVSQFTAKENMADRMKLVEAFNKGDISALAAIRCLDEGINIPSIESALILSSNDDYREFVQRRGRILRKYKDKKYANIHDVIVLPSSDMTTWASIEFRRYYEYARLAINRDQLLEDLQSKLSDYGLTLDDINTYEFEDVEVDLDE